jgi:hypothetical protein
MTTSELYSRPLRPGDPAFSRNPKPPALAGGVFTGQFVNDKRFLIFNALQKLVQSNRRRGASSISRRVNSFLTKLMTGNKSGALLLTTFVLKPGAANEPFIKGLEITCAALRKVSGFPNTSMRCPKFASLPNSWTWTRAIGREET